MAGQRSRQSVWVPIDSSAFGVSQEARIVRRVIGGRLQYGESIGRPADGVTRLLGLVKCTHAIAYRVDCSRLRVHLRGDA